MRPEDLEFVAGMARNRAGLMLGMERAFFVESRLATLARREGMPSVEALVAQLRAALVSDAALYVRRWPLPAASPSRRVISSPSLLRLR